MSLSLARQGHVQADMAQPSGNRIVLLIPVLDKSHRGLIINVEGVIANHRRQENIQRERENSVAVKFSQLSTSQHLCCGFCCGNKDADTERCWSEVSLFIQV